MIAALGPHHGAQIALLMDSAYEGNDMRELAVSLGLQPVVPPSPRLITVAFVAEVLRSVNTA